MTKLEVQALTLFKEHTLLELKSYKAHVESTDVGLTEASMDMEIVNRAIELHRYYVSYKLSGAKKENNINGSTAWTESHSIEECR